MAFDRVLYLRGRVAFPHPACLLGVPSLPLRMSCGWLSVHMPGVREATLDLVRVGGGGREERAREAACHLVRVRVRVRFRIRVRVGLGLGLGLGPGLGLGLGLGLELR